MLDESDQDVAGGAALARVAQDDGHVRGKGPVDWAFTTIAYDAATGARLWTAHYSGPGSAHFRSTFWAIAVAASPDSARVHVTGTAAAVGNLPSTATVAYDAATGTVQGLVRLSHQSPYGSLS